MAAKQGSESSIAGQVEDILAWLKRHGTKKTRDAMARYAIPQERAFGVPVGVMKREAGRIGRNHELSVALWKTGWYEARMMVSFLGEPDRVTAAQLDRWVRDFDNWAICDTMCFHFFDRTPHAWSKVASWAGRREEFVKRTAFALLWSLTVHDKQAGDESFRHGLQFVERAATDERNFVKKAVNMALRAVGKRNTALNASAVTVARRLAASSSPSAQWVGRDALRELTSPALAKRMALRRPKT